MICIACDRFVKAFNGNNPHYQSAVGWDTAPGDVVGDSIYKCTGETSQAVHTRRRQEVWGR